MNTMEILLGVLVTALLPVIGYFLVNLHGRFEEHLKESAVSQKEFASLEKSVAVLASEQNNQCERLDRVEGKIDDLPEKIAEIIVRGKSA